nr:tetratricopeptide repeat protein [Sorangium cellulosum]
MLGGRRAPRRRGRAAARGGAARGGAARPALSRGRVILCRNVLLYFERDQVPRLLGRLAAELVPGGHIVLSPAEGILPLPPELRRGPAPGWLQRPEGDAVEPASPRAQAEEGPASTGAGAAAREPGAEAAARLLGAGRADEAEQVLAALLNADPEHLEGWFLLGEALLARGERAQARAAFQRVLRCSAAGARHVDAGALRRAAARRAEALRDPR